MKIKKLLYIIMTVIIAAAPAAYTDTGDAGLPGAFLSWGAGARSLAMGRAFTAVANDATAVYWNPAGLSRVYSNQISLFHAILFESTSFSFAGYALPVSKNMSIGVGGAMLYSGDYDFRDVFNNGGETFKSQETAVFLSASRKIPWNLSLGLNIKLVKQEIFNYSASGQGIDLACLYEPLQWLKAGINVQNVVPPSIKLKEETDIYPLRENLGIATNLFHDKFIFAIDFSKTEKQSLKYGSGAEYWFNPNIALRTGWNQTEISAGIGLKLLNYGLDYAFGTQSMGSSHRISFTYDFGLFKSKVSAAPKLFSTLGDSETKTTTLKLIAWAKYNIQNWKLEIRDKNGSIIKTFEGEKNPPSTVIWDGRDNMGEKALDGIYTCVLILKDDDQRTWSSFSEKVEILTTVEEPAISIEISQ